MGRFHIEDLRGVEAQPTDPAALSAMIVKLILGSSEIEVNVFDSNEKYGTYVVVLQGTLDVGERVPIETGPPGEPAARRAGDAGAGPDNGHVAYESHPACPPIPPEDDE